MSLLYKVARNVTALFTAYVLKTAKSIFLISAQEKIGEIGLLIYLFDWLVFSVYVKIVQISWDFYRSEQSKKRHVLTLYNDRNVQYKRREGKT